jgi:glycosyltransferase involved in cell wall biosynthesis
MNKKLDLVSIIVPAKNEGQGLSLCLEAVLSQSYGNKNIEIIVIDNDSSDNTVVEAKRLGAKVLTKKDTTIASIRNYGANNSLGDIIGFLDADCIVHRDWIKVGMEHLEKAEVCVVGSPETWFANSPSWVERHWCDIKNGRPTALWKEVYWCSTQAMLIKRDIFCAVGRFNKDLDTCEDVDLSLKLCSVGKLIMDYRIPHQHMRGSKSLKEFFERERWRGRANLRGIFSHGLIFKEIPSIFVPMFLGLVLLTFFLMIPIGIVTGKKLYYLIAAIAGLLCWALPTLMVIKKVGIPKGVRPSLRYVIICFVYLLARFVALIFPGRREW